MTTSDHCPHIEDAPLLALGVLDADEAASLRAHAEGCEECRARPRRAGRTRRPSSTRLSCGSLRRRSTISCSRVRRSIVARPARRRRLAWLGAAAATCAVIAIALVDLRRWRCAGPAALATIRSELPGGTTSGEARLFNPDRPDGMLKLHLSDVPPAPSGTYYAVWVLPRGEKTMEAVGAFVPKNRSVDLTLSLPGRGDYRAVDISIQRVGGPSAHSDKSLAGGAFRTT